MFEPRLTENPVSGFCWQMPYAVVAAAVSFVSYIIAGFVPNALIVLPIAIVLMIGTLFAIKMVNNRKTVQDWNKERMKTCL